MMTWLRRFVRFMRQFRGWGFAANGRSDSGAWSDPGKYSEPLAPPDFSRRVFNMHWRRSAAKPSITSANKAETAKVSTATAVVTRAGHCGEIGD